MGFTYMRSRGVFLFKGPVKNRTENTTLNKSRLYEYPINTF